MSRRIFVLVSTAAAAGATLFPTVLGHVIFVG